MIKTANTNKPLSPPLLIINHPHAKQVCNATKGTKSTCKKEPCLVTFLWRLLLWHCFPKYRTAIAKNVVQHMIGCWSHREWLVIKRPQYFWSHKATTPYYENKSEGKSCGWLQSSCLLYFKSVAWMTDASTPHPIKTHLLSLFSLLSLALNQTDFWHAPDVGVVLWIQVCYL